MKLPPIPRLPRLPWPFRGRSGDAQHTEAAELGGTLRAFRAAALWVIAGLIITATSAAFAESYRGLWLWAEHHGLAGFWAAAFPLQIDLFVAVGEIVLFVAMIDRWRRGDRVGAWAVALLGLAASVAGNVGHVAAHDLQSRGTAAVPPIAAFAALWLGIGVLKRVIRRRSPAAVTTPAAADEIAQQYPPDGRVADLLAELTHAVRALAERADNTVSSPASGPDQTALLGELLEAVRGVGEQIGGAVSSPVPSGAEHAALIAYRATLAAGNPHSMNALQARFGLTRTQVQRIRAVITEEGGNPPELALANGHQAEA